MVCLFFLGCPLPNGRLLKVGEQYTNDECTRLCTCDENGLIQCIPLCRSRTEISLCPPQNQQKIRVPAGPAGSKCTCEHILCREPGMFSNSF